VFSDDNSGLDTNEPGSFKISSKISLEMPAVPEIHSVIFPFTSSIAYINKEYQDSSTQVNLLPTISTEKSLPASDLILQETEELDNGYLEMISCQPKYRASYRSPEFSTKKIPSPFIKDKVTHKHKPLPMVSLQQFSKCSSAKTDSAEPQTNIDRKSSLSETITIESAQRNIDAAIKEKKQEKHLEIMLSKLKENSDLLKNNYDTSKVSDSVSNGTRSENVRNTRKRNIAVSTDQHIKKTKSQLLNDNKITRKPFGSSTQKTISLPFTKKQSSLTLRKPKVVSYDHILPKVSTFNTAYITIKKNSCSNQTQRATKSPNQESSSPRKVISNANNMKINNNNANAYNTVFNNNNIKDNVLNYNAHNTIKKYSTKEETTPRKSNVRVKEKTNSSRAPFTDDSEKIIDEIEWYNIYQENSYSINKNGVENHVSCSSLTSPSLMVQATNKWVSTRAKHSKGEIISKSGRCISSRSSSTATNISSEECLYDHYVRCNQIQLEEQPKKQVEKSNNSMFLHNNNNNSYVPSSILNNNLLEQKLTLTKIDTYTQPRVKKPESIIKIADKLSVYSNDANNSLHYLATKELVEKPSQKGLRLEIHEEETEHIPLRSILCQSAKSCSRRVSFCEPVALYRTISPFKISETDPIVIPDSVFTPKLIKKVIFHADIPQQ